MSAKPADILLSSCGVKGCVLRLWCPRRQLLLRWERGPISFAMDFWTRLCHASRKRSEVIEVDHGSSALRHDRWICYERRWPHQDQDGLSHYGRGFIIMFTSKK